MAIKVLANTVNLSSASDVYKATAVRITNNGTARTVTIANTDVDTGDGQHGNYVGGQVSIRLNANEIVTVRKRPNDTVTGASGVYATKVAEVSS